MPMSKGKRPTLNPENYNWLTTKDHGKQVLVTGHYAGDFVGTVKYGGRLLAIVTDTNGNDIEVCYMKPVEFVLL